MKKISKIMSLVLAGVMVLSMTACEAIRLKPRQLPPRHRRRPRLMRLQRRKRQLRERPQRVRLPRRQREPPIRLAYSSWCSTPLWTLPMTVSSLP